MKRVQNTRHAVRVSAEFGIALALCVSVPAQAASIALATAPLANSTTTTVLPNLMFILDSSSSMGWDHLPDWVSSGLCKNTTGVNNYNRSCESNPAPAPPFYSPNFNGIYYNPAIRYTPPVDGAGNSYPSQTTWTNVRDNAFSTNNASTNLVANYPDVEWCTNDNYTDCLRNGNYLLPTTTDAARAINGKYYNFPRVATASGTANVAIGTPTVPSVESRTLGPHYYLIEPGEWCDSEKLTNCQTTQGGAFVYPARLRWCNNATNAAAENPAANTCQGLRVSGFTNPRYPTRYLKPVQTYVAPVAAFREINFNVSGCGTGSSNAGNAVTVSSITANGTNILRPPTGTSAKRSAADIVADIISRGAIAGSGYTFAAVSGNTSRLRITAPYAAGADVPVAISWTATLSGCSTRTPTETTLTGYVREIQASPAAFTGGFTRVDIIPGRTYSRGLARTDCASTASCSYNEEMTNFANWWTYYRTRMQTMKTATSLAFKEIDSRYRVGFIDIYGNNYLPIDMFSAGTNGVKDLWYRKLFSINPSGGTPLRSALARVGRIYAGQKPVGTADPMQYSCQQNFALLTTDGYWTDVDPNNSIIGLTRDPIGNMDGGSTPRPMYEGPTASENSLADVAKYYYDTDLRTTALGNCAGALGVDVCENNVFVSATDRNDKQHMTTFTLGLGVDGTLHYNSDYKTRQSGDYYNIEHGAGSDQVNWPVPRANTETAVDDLWHAAVNGQGTYFSAKDPAQLTAGLNGALASIGAKLGAGSAAATSSLNPVPGDNFAYVANYTTVKWQGNLEGRTINLSNGDISETPAWCVENTVETPCSAPGRIVSSTAGSSTAYFCEIPDATTETCRSGTLEGSTCRVEVAVSCSGTMPTRITRDDRVIKVAGATGLIDFRYANLSPAQKAYFSDTYARNLDQWASLSAEQKVTAAGENLVEYLRGQTRYEMNRGNNLATHLYRYREATMGDVTESQPVFLGKPSFRYADQGYAEYITTHINRARTVFVGANDGMLHAINAENGQERWAFIPSSVLPNLWRLADENYARKHANFVNGSPVIGDVYDSATASWKTILVGGLNGGGRGYYALDVTNPEAPSLLWEITSATESNLGYTYGRPVITKKHDGTWVVLFTSGYNNTTPGDGQGYLYVRNALTGASLARIATGVGSATTPSGLSRIAAYADDPTRNNTALNVYGGDVLGNVWRFDIDTDSMMRFATLRDALGNAQPITAAPELGTAYGRRLIFIGTGKYLEAIDLTDTSVQSLYALVDNANTGTLNNARLSLVQQTLTSEGSDRVASQNAVDARNGNGWFIDFPDSGERVHVAPTLDAGLLIVPTTVPSNTVCTPGGYGWLNYFNYLTGNNETGIVSQRYNAPIVGVNLFYTPDGKRRVSVVTADHPTPEQPPKRPPEGGNLPFQGKRVMWQEWIPEMAP